MAVVKKILKRTLGTLKMATAFAPFVVLGGSFLAFLGTGISALVYDSKLGGYMDTPIYQQEFLNDTEEYRRQLDDGEITFEEYAEKIEDMSSSSYKKSVVRRDIEGNEKWQAYLKNYNTLGISALSLLGTAALAGFWTYAWVELDKKDDFVWSAEEDFAWQPPKKPEPKPEPQEPVVEEKKEDLSSDEENLGSLDDYITNLQG